MIVTTLRRVSATPRSLAGGDDALVPVHRFAKAVSQGSPRDKTEPLAGPTGIHAPPGLAIRLRWIPSNFAAIPADVLDEHGQVRDRDLVAAAEIHRRGVIVE